MAEVNDTLREKGYNLCKDFLGGSWANLREEDFGIEYITGGLSNMLYLCSVSDKVVTKDGEQRKVLLRLYGQIIQKNPETVVTDSVIFALLAEKCMGPKLYGVFTGGRVEEYVKSRHLYTYELQFHDISMACARHMAKFHTLTMPLVKKPNWLFDTMTRYLDEALNNAPHSGTDPDHSEKVQKLLDHDLPSELDELRTILGRVHSPVVFCHNDLQEGNILYSQEGKRWQLIPIDFEYASYNYRGFDIANHFCEWCYDYSVKQPPYYSACLDHYPTRDQQLAFIRTYIEEEPPEGDCDPAELEENMLVEVEAFALASHFLWFLWSIVQADISHIKFNYLDYAKERCDAYYYHKKIVLNTLELKGL